MFQPPQSPGLPADHSDAFLTAGGVPYLTEPGVAVLAAPAFQMDGLVEFLDDFHPELEFEAYANDAALPSDAEMLVKVSGQLCYLSFGPKRSFNADAEKYFANILSSGHGSVLEHANYSVLMYGISRSVTHELVRHRAGFAFSQVSQRYVDGSKLRFVARPEWYEEDGEPGELFEMFIDRIEHSNDEYNRIAELLLERQRAKIAKLEAFGVSLADAGISKTDLRKEVNQAARECLPNEAEAPIVVTGNIRAWRHFLNMRGSLFADTAIRRVALKLAPIFRELAPNAFQDVEVKTHPYKGQHVVLQWPKV